MLLGWWWRRKGARNSVYFALVWPYLGICTSRAVVKWRQRSLAKSAYYFMKLWVSSYVYGAHAFGAHKTPLLKVSFHFFPPSCQHSFHLPGGLHFLLKYKAVLSYSSSTRQRQKFISNAPTSINIFKYSHTSAMCRPWKSRWQVN